MENKDYKCRNGAYHAEQCCATCWNLHPEAKKGEMFLGTPRQIEIIESIWIKEAMESGFSQSQAFFMLKRLA